MKGQAFRLLLLFFAISITARSQSKEWTDDFKEAESKFNSRQQTECISLFEELVKSMEAAAKDRNLSKQEISLITRSYDLLGQAEYNRNEQEKARAAFLKLIGWIPDYRMNEDLVSKKILDFFSSLKRQSLAMLTIQSTPPGATVRLDGRELGITNLENISVFEGRYMLEIQLPGYRAERKEVELKAGSMQDVRVTLAEDPVAAKFTKLQTDVKDAHGSGDQLNEAKALQKMARFQADQNKVKEAKESLERALKLVPELGNEDTSSALLLDLGILYEQTGAASRARETLEEAVALLRKGQNSALLAKALQNLGRIAFHANDLKSARSFDEEAVALFKTLGDSESPKESESRLLSIATQKRSLSGELLREAYALMGAGNYGDAEKKYLEALELARESGDKANQANALLNLGFLFSSSSRESEAVPYWEEALLLSREMGDSSREALSLYNLSIAAFNRGNRQKADELYEQSALIYKKLGDKPRKKLW